MKKINKAIQIVVFFLLQLCFFKTVFPQPESGAVKDYYNAQQFITDASGKPLSIKTEYAIEGTPFFRLITVLKTFS
ncbi:MAG TPA: hypothetical protein VET23_07630 [Chitinophagaceae bacterium]|nr:hypothetical protein [Chitinophagaceae bacterium]